VGLGRFVRLACAAFLLASGASACAQWDWSGGSSASGGGAAESPAQPERASLPKPVSVLGRVRPVHPVASPGELRWLGSYVRWWRGMSRDLRQVAVASEAILAGEVQESGDGEELRESLDRLRQCETEFSRRIRYPKTERLRRLHALLTDACFAVEGGAANGARILVHGAEAELVEQWRGEWDDAAGLMDEAFRRISAYDPSYARLPLQGGLSTVSRIEPRFGRAALNAAGKRVRVRCWSEEDWPRMVKRVRTFSAGEVTIQHVGFATVGAADLNLAPEICEWLMLLRYTDERPTGIGRVAIAVSVGTLAHESQHTRGVAEEDLAECYGMQLVRKTARALGAEAGYARALAKVYWEQVYKRAPPAYRSRDCRNGGAFDLRPASASWP
jgi:hypothetical protein